MKHLLVYAHPNKESFSHAILERCLETLSRLGAQVEVRDLYAMGFNPVYGLDDMGPVNKDHLPNDVILEQSYIKECDKITIISPIWWGYLPAILKGYFDRVFTEGFAYHQVDNQTIGLLSDKKIGMINTFYSKDVYPSGENIASIFNTIIEKSIFEYCKTPLCFHQNFFEVKTCGYKKRLEMLDEVERIIESFILDPNYCPYFG